jgi:hypothetical protein
MKMKTVSILIALCLCALPFAAHAAKSIGPGQKLYFVIKGGQPAQRTFKDVDLKVKGIDALKITTGKTLPFRLVAVNELPPGCVNKFDFLPVNVPNRFLAKGEKAFTGSVEGLSGMNGGSVSLRLSSWDASFNPKPGKLVVVTVEGVKRGHP